MKHESALVHSAAGDSLSAQARPLVEGGALSAVQSNPYGSGHIYQGGSGITNFDPRQLHIYMEAIKRHGDPAVYVGRPMSPGIPEDLALRRHGGFGDDFSTFWDVFQAVLEEHEAAIESARAAIERATS